MLYSMDALLIFFSISGLTNMLKETICMHGLYVEAACLMICLWSLCLSLYLSFFACLPVKWENGKPNQDAFWFAQIDVDFS